MWTGREFMPHSLACHSVHRLSKSKGSATLGISLSDWRKLKMRGSGHEERFQGFSSDCPPSCGGSDRLPVHIGLWFLSFCWYFQMNSFLNPQVGLSCPNSCNPLHVKIEVWRRECLLLRVSLHNQVTWFSRIPNHSEYTHSKSVPLETVLFSIQRQRHKTSSFPNPSFSKYLNNTHISWHSLFRQAVECSPTITYVHIVYLSLFYLQQDFSA